MDITRIIQNEIKVLVTAWSLMKEEAKDIGKVYWSTAVNTTIDALGGTDAATYSTHLIKNEFVSGITLNESLDKFFSNQAVTQADYIQSSNLLKYGSAATPTLRTDAVEQLGARIVQIAVDSIEIYKMCRVILEIYSAEEIGDMIANLDIQRMIPGSDMTKDQLSSGIFLVEQFKKLMNNEVVSTGDYASTLAKWQTIP
jgi:hypothetical protein